MTEAPSGYAARRRAEEIARARRGTLRAVTAGALLVLFGVVLQEEPRWWGEFGYGVLTGALVIGGSRWYVVQRHGLDALRRLDHYVWTPFWLVAYFVVVAYAPLPANVPFWLVWLLGGVGVLVWWLTRSRPEASADGGD